MRVLIGMEESGYLRAEFRRFGHDAWSCDLLPAADDPAHHLKRDVLEVLGFTAAKSWDLIIMHVECRFMAVSGNKHYAGTPERMQAIVDARKLWKRCLEVCDKVCFEQPVSVLTLPGAATQTLQPWNFHIAELKRTVLHTHGLPPLKEWCKIKPEVTYAKVHRMPPGPMRSRMRGWLPWLARPLAEQWGKDNGRHN